ncbi:uncharacterized protein V6R79_003540 [Siganus canaliculatus]
MGSGGGLRLVAALVAVLVALQVHALPTHSEYDADAGERREDILEINKGLDHLFEGDIARNPGKNALLDEQYRWKFPIPYILADSLDLNAKGVIHQAFEEYRLRSCVDFKPYEGESTFISFGKFSGCWSHVGDFRVGQNLSIGAGCDTKAIVEHELLHALGFYHEQSRSDRDDYVKIWWDEIEPGKEHNFNKYEDDFITDLNTPYDYESVMHYRPLSFNINDSVPTITTMIPFFNDIIGQRQDFSAVDIVRLNRMYDCANSLTLLDQCSFELTNICGMIQNEADTADWVQTLSSASDGDHTLDGSCRDSGYYMKFDTSTGGEGTSALLESRILYPTRDQQCLQFFYKMTGGAGDKLVIWIRTDDGTGNVRAVKKIHTIEGDGAADWKIASVPLQVTEKFRYFFQGIKGSATSSGGILIDDITLTETVCPTVVWQIQNFSTVLETTAAGTPLRSQCFFNSEGYSFGISVHPKGRAHPDTGVVESPDYVGLTVHLCSGENDAVLEWPAKNRQFTAVLMDQNPDITLRMSSTKSFTTVESDRWVKPTNESGTWDESCNCYRNIDYGWSTFISHPELNKRNYLKNDDLIISVDFNDLTHLIETEVPIVPATQSGDVAEQKAVDEVEVKQADLETPEESKEEEVPEPREEEAPKPREEEAPKPRQARSVDPCQANPCFNGGVCVERNGKASCRCATTQTTFYTGKNCEVENVDRTILGAFVGGVAGLVFLSMAIFTVIRRT